MGRVTLDEMYPLADALHMELGLSNDRSHITGGGWSGYNLKRWIYMAILCWLMLIYAILRL